ncbi:hypothetical protein ACIBF5_07095 [Micromonospora sp. NPDC050417]|uniref:hypothetical protein n=1 Tax=Micromonospora sp. NPDC050417 TaxID=3364280 RepID=UPI00378C1E56
MPSEADTTATGSQRAATPTIAVGTVPLVATGSIRPATPADHAVAILPGGSEHPNAPAATASAASTLTRPPVGATATVAAAAGTPPVGATLAAQTAPSVGATLAAQTAPPVGATTSVQGGPPVVRSPLVPWAAPTADHPICTRRAGPRGTSRQILGVCGWATVLGLVGLAAGLRGLVAVVAGLAPNWYEPTIAAMGLGGIALTMVAFLFVRHPRLPWIMLSLATLPLAANLALTLAAL